MTIAFLLLLAGLAAMACVTRYYLGPLTGHKCSKKLQNGAKNSNERGT